jgi:hypothetical protein
VILFADKVPDDHKPRIVFGHEFKASDVNYILASRLVGKPGRLLRRETAIRPPIWPIVDDTLEITPETVIQLVPASKEAALYCRDLWAHKLGTTRSEAYFFMLLDGKVSSVFGMFFDKLVRGQLPMVSETFGFSAPVRRYKRLNKLMMMCLISGEGRDFFASQPAARASMMPLTTFQTSCLATTPETKGDRGIGVKLVGRRKIREGAWHLNFRGPFNKMSYADCRDKWLRKDGRVGSDALANSPQPPKEAGAAPVVPAGRDAG